MLRGVGLGIVGSLILILSLFLLHYKKSYEDAIVRLSECVMKTDTLIATLKNKELKLKEYLEQKPKVEEKIITKYKIIKQKDEDCQSFKEGVHEILNVFYSHPPP